MRGCCSHASVLSVVRLSVVRACVRVRACACVRVRACVCVFFAASTDLKNKDVKKNLRAIYKIVNASDAGALPASVF